MIIQTAAPAQVDDSTGGIMGTVLDEEENPLEGVAVGILGDGLVATITDGAGAFSFSHVAPGKQALVVQALGYKAASLSVEVVAGQVTHDISVKLVREAIVVPYHATQIKNGLFGCGLSWRPAVAVSGIAVCGVLSEVPVDTSQYDRFLINWEAQGPSKAFNDSVIEMQWASSQLLGKGLSFIWEMDGCINANGGAGRFSTAQGRSPIHAVAGLQNMTKALKAGCASKACGTDNCKVVSRVFATPETLGSTSAADVGFSFEQPFTQYLSTFYYAPSAPGYTALPQS